MFLVHSIKIKKYIYAPSKNEIGKLYVTGAFTEYNSNDEKTVLLSTIVCNEDGTVTAAVYRMK